MSETAVDLSGMTHLDRRRIARLVHESRADWVVLVGSWARGTQTASTSDIDLLVGKRAEGRQPTEERMHVFYLDSAQLKARITTGDDVALWFLKFGVPISGAGRWGVLRDSLLKSQPNVDVEKKFRLAEGQLQYAEDLLQMGDLEAAQEELYVGAEHLARGLLLDMGKFPGSRPEIPSELRANGHVTLARLIEDLRNRQLQAGTFADAILLNKRALHDAAYSRRLRSDPQFVHASDAADERIEAGPPWDDEFSPSRLLEETDRPQP